MRSSLGVLPLVARWNRARYKRGERNGNLNKKHFLQFGVLSLFYVLRLILRVGTLRAQHSKCHPRHFFILGSSLVFDKEGIRKEQRKGILKIVRFAHSLEDGTLCLLFRGRGEAATG